MTTTQARPHRVTVLDDDPQLVELLADLLGEDGYLVSCLTRTEPTLASIVATDPDLVIVDLLLDRDAAGLTGWDVVRLARSHADLHRVPIVLISADAKRLADVQRSPEAAGIRLIEKPFALETLMATVREAIGDAVGPRSREATRAAAEGT